MQLPHSPFVLHFVAAIGHKKGEGEGEEEQEEEEEEYTDSDNRTVVLAHHDYTAMEV